MEIERAFIIRDIEPVLASLSAAGFVPVELKNPQKNEYLEHPFLPGMLEQKKYFRVRTSPGKNEISFSNPVSDDKATEIRRDYSAKFMSGNKGRIHFNFVKKILNNLGFTVVLILNKTRSTYIAGDGLTGIHVEIDENISINYKGVAAPLATTVQVCIESEKEIPGINDVFDEVVSMLGIDPASVTRENYFERFFAHLEKH